MHSKALPWVSIGNQICYHDQEQSHFNTYLIKPIKFKRPVLNSIQGTHLVNLITLTHTPADDAVTSLTLLAVLGGQEYSPDTPSPDHLHVKSTKLQSVPTEEFSLLTNINACYIAYGRHL